MPNVTVSVVVRDLTEAVLGALQWSGTASHLIADFPGGRASRAAVIRRRHAARR